MKMHAPFTMPWPPSNVLMQKLIFIFTKLREGTTS